MNDATELDFTKTLPQTFYDSWCNITRTMRYDGKCVCCERRCYYFTDGKNDPRGPLGDNAAGSMVAKDYDMEGPDVVICSLCENDYDSYKFVLDFAKQGKWQDRPVREEPVP